jgi:hypothetical protein
MTVSDENIPDSLEICGCCGVRVVNSRLLMLLLRAPTHGVGLPADWPTVVVTHVSEKLPALALGVASDVAEAAAVVLITELTGAGNKATVVLGVVVVSAWFSFVSAVTIGETLTPN